MKNPGWWRGVIVRDPAIDVIATLRHQDRAVMNVMTVLRLMSLPVKSR